MPSRLMGLEAEFCIRRSASSSSARRPSTKDVCRAILDTLDHVVDTAPGEREGWPRYQRFVQNGGAFSFEVTRVDATDGVLESATPECRGASQLLLYERAQEALLQRVLPGARRQLAADGWDCDIAIVKNGRDAEGHVYGAQENYEAEIARGWRLFVYRLVLAALLPGILCWAAAMLLVGAFAVLAFLAGLVIFPLARHWVGLDWYSQARSADEEQPPPSVMRIAAAAAIATMSPISLTFLWLLRAIAFRDIRSQAMAFLLSRPVMTGAGTLRPDGSFALSERAESITSTIRTSLRQRSRAVFDTGNLLKLLMLDSGGLAATLTAVFSRRQRLQLGVSDSNCAQTAEFLKLGTTALVIDMVEAGVLRDAPRVRRPIRALKRISRDPALQARVAVKRRESMTALEIQQWYLRRAEEFLSSQRVASLESKEIVTLWRKTLQALERNPPGLVGRIDWVTKRMLMADAGTLNDAARKKIDIKYHEIGTGYFSMLEQKGIAPVRLSAHDIGAAIVRPPTNTPAWQRGQSIRQAGQERGSLRVSFLPGPERNRHSG